jgi:hypothetical protein
MAKDPDRQMTVPELLEARAKVKRQLELPMAGGLRRGMSEPAGQYEKAGLRLILQEIETELAELGHRDTEAS